MTMAETVDITTGEIVQYHQPSGALLPTRQSPAELAHQAEELREMMRAVLQENTDYGVIPGTNKPSLFKSGAEWLLKWAGFGHRLEPVEIERDGDGRKYGVTYRCTVHLLSDSHAVVATCDGYAGYDEDRFLQTVTALEAKERANASKYQRPAKPEKWAEEYRAPWNSVLKMAEKRAFVGATLQATATSSLFTQDLEDNAPPAAPPDPEAWFKENGWTSKAQHDTARDALVAAIKDARLDEARDDFKAWMASSGYSFTKALTLAAAEDIAAMVERMASGDTSAAPAVSETEPYSPDEEPF